MMDAGQIYEEFRPKVRAYVRGKIQDPHDAQELVSAVFMKVVQKLESLADALLTLKEKERDLIVLHYYSGHTLKTVAEMMGMSYVNAKVIHEKALTGLQEFLQQADTCSFRDILKR